MASGNQASDAQPSPGTASADGFGSTAWSIVLAAAEDATGGAALDRLCRRYWRPAYTFARRSGLPRWDAEDATQDFFGHLLAGDWLKQADPNRGSFRAFLLTLLRNFLANRRRHEQAQKRGGALRAVALDTEECERDLAALVSVDVDPALAYERAWAACVLQSALERLAAEQTEAEDAVRFAALRPFLTQAPAPGDYDRLGQTLGLSRNRIAVTIHRLSRRFAELIRAEVADTLADRSQLDGELRGLLGALAH